MTKETEAVNLAAQILEGKLEDLPDMGEASEASRGCRGLRRKTS